jgi:DNA-binding MurR/RpiR family transcriptional regulator
VREALRSRCTLVAIADRPGSPMAEGADHCLVFDAGSTPAFFPSLTGAISIAQALADEIFRLGGRQSAARLRKTEARLSALAQYVPDKLSHRRKARERKRGGPNR